MFDFSKIAYYDLKLEAMKGRLGSLVGREDEVTRISRVVKRRINNNCLIVGPGGIGKSALVRGWARATVSQPDFKRKAIVQLDSESFNALNSNTPALLHKFKEALESVPEAAVVIDNFGQLVFGKTAVLNNVVNLLKPLLENPSRQVILILENREYQWLETEVPALLGYFEAIMLKKQDSSEQLAILKQALETLARNGSPLVTDEVLDLMLKLAERFPVLGQLPSGAVSMLDESLALASVERSAEVTESHVYRIVSDKTGIPVKQLQANDKELVKNLENELNRKIVGQKQAVEKITSIIKRAKLGLKNPRRPLGSFLVLGPSGVGKTETAKLVAEMVFGKPESFIRVDMSEFGQEHTVHRLIGAPPGYVGYDAGGALTNGVKRQPYSLVLLDEIEKAHPKVFDIFLQILDDGRLTSGQGETVDFTQTIVMATSNLAVGEIIGGFNGPENIFSEEFLRDKLMPALTAAFRPEFVNRFDAVTVFKPLTEEDLLAVAQLEIKKVEERARKHNIKFTIDPEILAEKIKSLADQRFGARPVKRFVENTCETLISKALLS